MSLTKAIAWSLALYAGCIGVAYASEVIRAPDVCCDPVQCWECAKPERSPDAGAP